MAARWSTAEDELLARLYARGVSVREIGARLARSGDAVVARRGALGIPDRRARKWSARADALIRAGAAAGVPATVLAPRFGLSPDRLRRRRAQLAGRAPAALRYSIAEDQAIRTAYAEGADIAPLALTLGRTPDALRGRARTLGASRPTSRREAWTANEDDALRAGYAVGLSCKEIVVRVLPERTSGAVGARARKLGLGSYARLWSATEDERLRSLGRAGASIDRVALVLTRTPEAVRRRARKLGVTVPRPGMYPRAGRPWTRDEDALLRREPGAHPAGLARALGRSDHAICARARALGLRVGRERSPHHVQPSNAAFTPGEERVLVRELTGRDGGMSRVLAVSKRLQRPPGELRRHLTRIMPAQDSAVTSG